MKKLTDVTRDLQFLKEMKSHIDAIKDHADITRIESLETMVNDWIDELQKLCLK